MKNAFRREGGFTLVEAAASMVILAIGVVALLSTRAHSVSGANKIRYMRAAKRLAFDLAARVEAEVPPFGGMVIGDTRAGYFYDNREGFTPRVDDKATDRDLYEAYPEDESEPSYPPGLKFELEITAEGQPAELMPAKFEDTRERYDQRQSLYKSRQDDMDSSIYGSSSSQEVDPTTGEPVDPLEEGEEIIEEVRRVTIFVRCNLPDKKNFLLFELQHEYTWRNPDAELLEEQAAADAGASGDGSTGGGSNPGSSGATGDVGGTGR